MRHLNLFGSLPGLISENTAPWDWMGQLRLSIDPAQIRFVDVIGSGADIFDATLLRQFGTVLITPIARVDFESFARAGQAAELSLTLRFFMMDGTVAQSTQSFGVSVLDVDDTPPQALTLSTSGAVPFGVAGATIGTLAVTDPDTAAGFTFGISEEDSWLFEVAGNALRLKAGVQLSELDGPRRAVTIEVGDGHQSAAFTVSFAVTDPRAPAGQAINLLMPGLSKAGFSWSADGVLMGDVMSAQVQSIRDYGSLLNIRLDGGESLWVNQPRTIDLLDGRILYDDQRATRIWNLVETVLDRDPSLKDMQALYKWMETGTEAGMINMALADLQGLSNAQLVQRFHANATGWVVPQTVTDYAAAIDAGLPRAAVLLDFMNWRKGLGHEAARADQGIFVPRANAHEVDILLKVGGGLASDGATRWWADRINEGTYSLEFLALCVSALPGYHAGVGGMDTRSFTAEFYRQALGMDYSPAAIDWWGQAFANHAMSQVRFMADVAKLVEYRDYATSYVFDRPDAAAFAAPWF